MSRSLTGAEIAALVGKAERRRERLLFGITAPAIGFVLVFFLLPIGFFLFRSVDNPEVHGALPQTVTALRQWDRTAPPDEAAFAALISDLRALRGKPELAMLARRLNYDIAGFRTVIIRSARLAGEAAPPYRESLIANEPAWADIAYWGAIRNEAAPLTDFYLLAAFDLRRTADGRIAPVDKESALFLDLFARTFWISFTVTALCLIIGFPVAAVIARARPKTANLLLILVLLPFWSSLLVRATAWIVLLQDEGLVNQALMALGIIAHPIRLVFNRIGLTIAMTHVLLPFMILPLYSVLRGIPHEQMRAAASLGAKPVTAFRRVYLPQALPGIVAGSTLVFVISLGYYVAPALVGGPRDQMIGYFIAYFTNSTANWGMASALGTLLLVLVALIYLVLARTVGLQRLRAG
jgi:putative spermidine/putrescine transport system permease protein